MKPGRRLSLQLTPLLDLLLIVIFAQHLEVLQSARSAQQEVARQQSEVTSARDLLAAEASEHRAALESELAEQRAAAARQRQEYNDRLQSLAEQQLQAARVLTDAFQLPTELLEQLAQLSAAGRPADVQRLQAAAERLQAVLESRGDEFLQFMIRFDEMQKHVSVWEIHLQDNGQALFTDGEQSHTLSYESSAEFSGRLFEASKSFQEPRVLVLLMLTYGDAQAGQRRRAIDAMPDLIERLRRDAAGTCWFDFSLMGFRPQGPMFQRTVNRQP